VRHRGEVWEGAVLVLAAPYELGRDEGLETVVGAMEICEAVLKKGPNLVVGDVERTNVRRD